MNRADRDYREREVDRDVTYSDREDVRAVAGVNFILGIWLIISPWIFSYTSGAVQWDQFGFGIAVVVLSVIRYAVPRSSWASWLNALIGIWMIIAPFALSANRAVAYWNEVIIGIVIAILAFSNMRSYAHHRTTV
ncbi:MAG TPA: SPW repeat protein [Candidatus Saccharimonadales bacterium]|nr:SPW repeat protein [Candidatus Saccharimonadales bacterium]